MEKLTVIGINQKPGGRGVESCKEKLAAKSTMDNTDSFLKNKQHQRKTNTGSDTR